MGPRGYPLHFLDRTLPTIEENLALDEALLVEVEDGRESPHLRVWELPFPAVVLGASGRLLRDVIVDACRRDGVPITRRSSGGGTVVVGPGALNFTVVLARDAAPGLEAVDFAQHYVLERLAATLRARGAAVDVLGSGDLAVDRRKVAGSAQRRLKHHFLVHATILYAFPLELIDRYTRPPERQPLYREGRPHSEFVTNLWMSRSGLVDALQTAWNVTPECPAIAVPEAAVRALTTAKFADPAWVARL